MALAGKFRILRDTERYGTLAGSAFPAVIEVEGSRSQAQALCDALSTYFDAGCDALFYIEGE